MMSQIAIDKSSELLEIWDMLDIDGDMSRKNTSKVLVHTLFVFIFYIAANAVFYSQVSMAISIVSVIVAVISLCAIETIGHTASHNAISRSPRVNRLIFLLCYPLTMGLSSTFWDNKHIRSHHRNTNIIGEDIDIDLAPYVALTDIDVWFSRGILRSYYKFQIFLFPILLFFSSFHSLYDSFQYVVMGAIRGQGKKNRQDLYSFVAWVVVWYVIPGILFGWVLSAVFFVARYGFLSFINLCIFAPAHFPIKAICYTRRSVPTNRIQHQCDTTLNYTVSWPLSLITNGVEYQIEHHLYPSVCHTQLPRISSRLRSELEVRGYRYERMNWLASIVASLKSIAVQKAVLL